jgi:hypothetical protein
LNLNFICIRTLLISDNALPNLGFFKCFPIYNKLYVYLFWVVLEFEFKAFGCQVCAVPLQPYLQPHLWHEFCNSCCFCFIMCFLEKNSGNIKGKAWNFIFLLPNMSLHFFSITVIRDS